MADHGLLELTTWSVERQDTDLEAFGKLRIVEILGDDPNGDEQTVAFQTLRQGQPLEAIFTTQMIIDVDVPSGAAQSSLPPSHAPYFNG